jgi:hypothetical protein
VRVTKGDQPATWAGRRPACRRPFGSLLEVGHPEVMRFICDVNVVLLQAAFVGTDLVPEMVAAARRAPDRLALGNARFDVAPADGLPFPVDTFDAVISRFGIMFFPSPVDAVREC